MLDWINVTLEGLKEALEEPIQGLITIFIITLLSGTILPIGSEPFVLAYAALFPNLIWPTLIVSTIGNTIGGYTNYYTGFLISKGQKSWGKEESQGKGKKWLHRAEKLLQQYGAKAMFFSWLPLIGEVMCILAGWRKLPFWECTFYMVVGRFVRYFILVGWIWLI